MTEHKFHLKFVERLVLLSILPKEGDFRTLKLLRKFREELSLTSDENEALNPVQEGDSVRWNMAADVPAEFSIPSPIVSLVSDVLAGFDKNKQLTENMISLYEKFVAVDGD